MEDIINVIVYGTPYGVPGATGAQGPVGPGNTLVGPTGPPGPSINKNILLFSSNPLVSDNEFMGVSSSSSNFLENSVLVQYHCLTYRLGFSIRKPRQNTTYSATLYINGNPTLLKTQIIDGSTSISNITLGSIPINALDLISIHLEFSDKSILNDVILCFLNSDSI